MKGQKDQRGRNCLNGTRCEEIGERKESRERRCGDGGHFEKREDDENDDDLKIGMEE